jgi:hypothetical protein
VFSSNNKEVWKAVDDGKIFETELVKNQQNTRSRIEFKEPINAKYIKICPITWEYSIALRCGLIIQNK